MLLRLCQLKSQSLLALLVVSSCSFFRSNNDQAIELLTPMKTEWFSTNPQHALYDQQGKPQTHNFFDVNPEFSKSDVNVNAVIVVPEGADYSYQLDIYSGQRFYSHSYCPQSDIWGEYSASIKKPVFSIGFIPRLLDQIGDPQKVIILGGAQNFSKRIDFHQYRTRLVGAVIEQTCPLGNCLGKNNWISRMVFIGVDPTDSKFEKITDVGSLQKTIDWLQTKAVLENLDGRNEGGSTSFPAVRIGQFIKLDEAMEYNKKRSIYLSEKETQNIRKGCHSLYEKLWEEVGIERPEDKAAKTLEELNAKLKLRSELTKELKPVGFAARFEAFSKKYYSEFTTCQKFVYAGNINLNPEKFWFLSYVGMFFRLHKDGYYYDCKGQSWRKNNLDNAGKPLYDIKTGLIDCRDADFDRAMEFLPNFLIGIKNTENTFYKFVDYDTRSFGTHQKIYSWVKVKSRKYDCYPDPNIEIKKQVKVFPEDVSWKTRKIKDIADELKIIY